MSTGVTPKTLSQLHRMTDSEFHGVLIAMASITLPAGAASAGFFARLAQTSIGGKLIGYATSKTGAWIGTFLTLLVSEATQGNNPFAKEAIIGLILEQTGLEMETLDIEGAKRAIGKKLADDINLKYGTEFAPFYPPENIIEDVKAQLLSEIMGAVH
jgi:hypothetical protein